MILIKGTECFFFIYVGDDSCCLLSGCVFVTQHGIELERINLVTLTSDDNSVTVHHITVYDQSIHSD